METNHLEPLLRFSNLAVALGANLLLQSTLLIAAGLIAARMLRRKGAALQSAVLRATLMAVVLCPLATLGLSAMGVGGITLDLPKATMREIDAPLLSATPEPSAPEPAAFPVWNPVNPPPLPVVRNDVFSEMPPTGTGPADAAPLTSEKKSGAGSNDLAILYIALTTAWLLVSALLAIRLLLAHVRMARVRRVAQEGSAALKGLCRNLAREMHLKPPILGTSPVVKSPCLTGLIRPSILLPESYGAGNLSALREVLVHELAHLARRDCAWNFLGRIARSVVFFQPLLWPLTRRIEEASDDVADDYVVQHGLDRRRYAHQLVDIAERYQPAPSEALAGMGVISLKSSLSRRVRRILDTTRALSLRIGTGTALVVVAVGLCGVLAGGLIGAEGGNGAGDATRAREDNEPVAVSASAGQSAPKSIGEIPPSFTFSAGQSAPKSIGEIPPPFTFRIRTETPEGNPQAGVKIRCLHPREERGATLVDVVATSNEEGIAEFRVTKADLVRDRYYWFSLGDEAFAGTRGVGISPVDEEYEYTFRVAPTRPYRFLVLDESDKPVPEAMVRLLAGEHTRLAAMQTARSDDEGRATVLFPAVKTDIVASARGYAFTLVTGVDLPENEPFTIRMQPGYTIEGQVTDERGKPLGRVRIEAREEGLPYRAYDEFILKAVTNAAGEFTLTQARKGTYEIQADVDDPARPLFAEAVSVRVGRFARQARVKIQAKPGAVLKGRYVTRHPLRTANRQIFVNVFEPNRAHWERTTAADGTFVLHLPAGTHGKIDFIGVSGYHNVAKVPERFRSLSAEDRGIRFRQVPPGIYDGIEIHFTLEGVAHGTVVDDLGKRWGDLAVIVHPGGVIYRTRPDGTYRAEIPPDQEVWLEVRDSSARETILKTAPFKVKEGEIVEKNIIIPCPLRQPPPEGGTVSAPPDRIGAERGKSEADTDSALQEWIGQLKGLETHGQAAFGAGQRLVGLDPDFGLEVVRHAWPELANANVKTGLLKAFAFSKALAPKKHPHVLQVLHLGVSDDDARVRKYALAYVSEYAMETFGEDNDAYAAWYEQYGDKPLERVYRDNILRTRPALETKLQSIVAAFKAGDLREVERIGREIAKHRDPIAIPTLIGIIDADNSYSTVYGIGYFALGMDGLGDVIGVRYCSFHDGAWWRRWWARNKSRFDEEAQQQPIPDLPKTKHGMSYKPYPAELDTLDGLQRFLVQQIGNLDTEPRNANGIREAQNLIREAADEIGRFNEPRAIPFLIGAMEADNSPDTIRNVGQALAPLTGARYNRFHDGAWWRRWWEANKSRYPEDVRSIAIPAIPKTKHGQNYTPLPETAETLEGRLDLLVQQLQNGAPAGDIWSLATDINQFKDPRAIPTLIGLIEADNTYNTVYGIGYYGLRGLTGVEYSEEHDGAWWRKWWAENKSKYPADAQQMEISDYRELAAVWKRKAEARSREAAMADIQDVPAEDLTVDGQSRMRYFLIGAGEGAEPPAAGYNLVVVLPGGDGGESFHPFVRRIYKFALGQEFLVAQPVAFKWHGLQRIVWPTRTHAALGQKFGTEDFVAAVIADVKKRHKVSDRNIFTLSWSSGGPAAYAISLQEEKAVTGSYIMASVFRREWLPPLERAKGRVYLLDHSPTDNICAFSHAKDAQATLQDNGATVRLTTYPGGHGVGGDVFKRVREGMGWLAAQQAQVNALVPKSVEAGNGVKPSESKEAPRLLRYVRLVVEPDRMTFQGRETTWEKLPDLLVKVADRPQVALELGITTDTLTLAALNEARGRADHLARQLQFDHLTYIGRQPPGSWGSAVFEGPFVLDRQIPLTLANGTADQPEMAKAEWIKFENRDGQVKATLHIKILSWPKTKWSFLVSLRTAEDETVRDAQAQYENSGSIERYPFLEEAVLAFSFGSWDNVKKAARFRVSIGQAFLSAPKSRSAVVEGE